MRFQIDTTTTHPGVSVPCVWDTVMRRVVPGSATGDASEVLAIKNVMNQRVERPELTRADGKLVSMRNA